MKLLRTPISRNKWLSLTTKVKTLRHCTNMSPVATIGYWPPQLLCPVAAIGHCHRSLLLATIRRLFSISLTMNFVNGLCCTQETDTQCNSPFAQLSIIVKKMVKSRQLKTKKSFPLPTPNTFRSSWICVKWKQLYPKIIYVCARSDGFHTGTIEIKYLLVACIRHKTQKCPRMRRA